MFEKAIQKLKGERTKLTNKAKLNDAEYKNEIRRIDTAIQKFEEGMAALGSKEAMAAKRSASQEIEAILAAEGSLHVKAITEELHRRGYSIALQSVSGVLQTYAKQKKKYRRVAPATFTLLAKGKKAATRTAA